MTVRPVPKPTRQRIPRQRCRCGKLFTPRALLRHAKGCGQKNRLRSVAKKTIVDGESFPSRLEAETWVNLKSLQRAGYYREVERYPTVELLPGVKWKVDFTMVRPYGLREYAESKGVRTERYRILLAIWREIGPGPLRIFEADRHGNPVEVETVLPRRGPL